MSGEGDKLHRRGFLVRGGAAASALLLGGCDDNWSDHTVLQRILGSAETLTRTAQRALLPETALAPEFAESDISPHFRQNGSTNPNTPEYVAHAKSGFADWKLQVGGLVDKKLELSLADLRALPSRTQITRHDCVEGWSCIGKWKGVPLKTVLDQAGLKPQARYIVFHCADDIGDTGTDDGKYYESIGMPDALHPQTILAYEMNGETLAIPHGAPIRLRVERQLGYKMAKYVMRIEAVDTLGNIRGGNGGYWEDLGYEWYGGI